ncbi:MAG: hypothetical protein J6M39_00760 [Lachnospiraceae bacterium]|nr:hypothetical protein [Lachnospiraceae bacterium]
MDNLVIGICVRKCECFNKNYNTRKTATNKTLEKVYVVSRLKGDIKNNIELAKKYCRFVDSIGKMPVASHIMYPAMGFDDTNPFEREKCRIYGLELLKLCDSVYCFIKDDVISTGMREEIRVARELNIPIKYFRVLEGGYYECTGYLYN